MISKTMLDMFQETELSSVAHTLCRSVRQCEVPINLKTWLSKIPVAHPEHKANTRPTSSYIQDVQSDVANTNLPIFANNGDMIPHDVDDAVQGVASIFSTVQAFTLPACVWPLS